MCRILIVEDEPEIARALENYWPTETLPNTQCSSLAPPPETPAVK